MSKHTVFDITIVGGGLAGASLALALANINITKQPLRIAIVETKPIITLTTHNDDARTLVLSYGSARIYQALNLWGKIKPHTHTLKHIHVSEKGCFGATRFSAQQQQVDALGYVVPLVTLQQQIITALQHYDHITWFCPDTVTQLQRDGAISTVRLQQAGDIQSRLVIAADGMASKVRQLLHIETNQQDYAEQALITQVDATCVSHTAYERFSTKGTIAILPISPTRASIVWTGAPEHVATWQALDDVTFLTALQRSFGYRAGKFSHVGKRHVYPLQLTRATESVRDGVVLIGHAAHTIHPIAAQGFNLSLRDVATLAEIINTGCNNGKALSDHSLLSEYHNWRKHDQATVIGFTDLLARVFQHDLLPLCLARNAGLLGCDAISPVKNTLARYMMGIAGHLPRMACGVEL